MSGSSRKQNYRGGQKEGVLCQGAMRFIWALESNLMATSLRLLMPSGMLGASGIWLGLTLNLTLVVWETPVLWLFPASDKGSLMYQGGCLGPGVFSGWGLPIQEDSFQVEGEFRHRLPTERQEP